MRSDIAAPSSTTFRNRDPSVIVFPTNVTPRALFLAGTDYGSLDGTDVSAAVKRIVQTDTGASISLAYSDLSAATYALFVPEACMSIRDGSSPVVVVFNGIIESVRDNEARGVDKTLDLVLRRRDATPFWREVRRVSDIYPAGVDLGMVARGFLNASAMQPDEYNIPGVGVTLAHDTAQLAELTLWEILRTVLEPGMREPFVDGRGFVKTISRDIRRDSTYQVGDAQVLELGSTTVRAPITEVVVRYNAPTLTMVEQERRLLAEVRTTTSFWDPVAHHEYKWSSDGAQRAKDLSFTVKKNPVSPFLPYTITHDEGIFDGWVQVYGDSPTRGLDGLMYSLADVFQEFLEIAAAQVDPDEAWWNPLNWLDEGGEAGGVGGPIATLWAILGTLTSVHEGHFQVHGKPYDFVRDIRQVRAFDDSSVAWHDKTHEIESGMIPDIHVARALAVGELQYRVREASRVSLTLVDDFRFEPADIIAMDDGRRFYLQGYSRELTRGAEAVVQAEGFWACP